MNNSGKEFVCPVESALNLISGKWKPLILYRLGQGTLRFGELQRAIPDVTQRMLTLQLRELERDGLINRKVYAEVPPKVEYSLTHAAADMEPILGAFGAWFDKHATKLETQRKVLPATEFSAKSG